MPRLGQKVASPTPSLPTLKQRVHVGRYTARRAARLKRAFLVEFARTGNLGHSAATVGILSRQTVYAWLEHDEEFSQAYANAEIEATEALEREALRRAVEGTPYRRTSYYRGKVVGTDEKTEYSDTLLMLLLRARAPEKYRETVRLDANQIIKAVGVDPASVL